MAQPSFSYWPFELDRSHAYVCGADVFSAEQCDSIISVGNSLGLESAAVFAPKGDGVDMQVRDCETSWITPAADSQFMYERLSGFVTQVNSQYFNFEVSGFAEGFQFTKYTAPSGNYGKHIDCVNGFITRKLSFIVQLSDPTDYEGGELVLHNSLEPTVLPKTRGQAIVFPSYALHEVTPVTRGTRYSLVGWVTGPRFK